MPVGPPEETLPVESILLQIARIEHAIAPFKKTAALLLASFVAPIESGPVCPFLAALAMLKIVLPSTDVLGTQRR